MKPRRIHASARTAGFTLLEMMVAMSLMVIALTIAFESFSASLRAWKRGSEVIDSMKHGEFVMNRLAAAVDSAIYFRNQRKAYAFKIEKKNEGGLPADVIDFVTASDAFMPADSPLREAPHRIRLFIDDRDGEPALYLLAMPAIADEEEFEDAFDPEPVLTSRLVRGLKIEIYDEQNEEWTDEWEKGNSIPKRIRLSVYVMADPDSDDAPVLFVRVIDIPVATSLKANLTGPTLRRRRGRTKRPTDNRVIVAKPKH